MQITQQATEILLLALRYANEGQSWNEELLSAVEAELDSPDMTIKALFPNGVQDLAHYLSLWADQEMLVQLQSDGDMRIRDKVHHAVWTRLMILQPYREALKQVTKYWVRPDRGFQAGHVIWETADTIWDWAGDTSVDYNRYTKRGLLCGVISATTLFFMRDKSTNFEASQAFLTRKIEAVVFVGQKAGQAIGMISSVMSNLPFCPKKSAG